MLSHKQGGFMKFLLLLTCLLFSAEMEVDGNLKVTGTVDASGNAITNVGAPQTMTDAVNAGILQSALSDDGVYEYMFILGRIKQFASNTDGVERWSQYMILSEVQVSSSSWTDGLSSILNQYSEEGWVIQFLDTHIDNNYKVNLQILYQLKRKIND